MITSETIMNTVTGSDRENTVRELIIWASGWINTINPYGPSALTARTCNSGQANTCTGSCEPRKLTAVTMNGRTVFVPLPVASDGKVRVTYGQIYRMFPNLKPGYCLVPGR
jgi:hypothetical protein